MQTTKKKLEELLGETTRTDCGINVTFQVQLQILNELKEANKHLRLLTRQNSKGAAK